LPSWQPQLHDKIRIGETFWVRRCIPASCDKVGSQGV
jgi:hypothetical protein